MQITYRDPLAQSNVMGKILRKDVNGLGTVLENSRRGTRAATIADGLKAYERGIVCQSQSPALAVLRSSLHAHCTIWW